EAPAGLALVVEKMMAKLPADRFQTAAEVAEALLPYVASSSASLPHLRTTVTFQRGQLTMRGLKPPPRWLKRLLVGAAAAVLVLRACAGLLLDHLEVDAGPEQVQMNGSELAEITLADGDAPVVIQDCTVSRGACNIVIAGPLQPFPTPATTRILVRNNVLLKP